MNDYIIQNWKLLAKEWTEATLDFEDLRYINSCKTDRLSYLWKRLDRLKFCVFPKIKQNKQIKKTYFFEWKNYSIYELSELSWINWNTLYRRINYDARDIKIALTTKPRN